MSDAPITLTGNLTADPELRFTPSGVAVATFTVASTPRRYDRESESFVDGETVFMRCAAWREMAENVADSLRKGCRTVVSGTLKQRHWENDAGEKRSAYEVEVAEVGPSLRWARATVVRPARPEHAGDAAYTRPPVRAVAG